LSEFAENAKIYTAPANSGKNSQWITPFRFKEGKFPNDAGWRLKGRFTTAFFQYNFTIPCSDLIKKILTSRKPGEPTKSNQHVNHNQ